MHIDVVSRKHCPQCNIVLRELEKLGFEFTEIEPEEMTIEMNQQVLDHGVTALPIIFIDGQLKSLSYLKITL